MTLTKTEIQEQCRRLIEKFHSWDPEEGFNTKTFSVCYKGREFRVLRNHNIDKQFKRHGIAHEIYDNINYLCLKTGREYRRVEFSIGNCGINEYSDFVATLKENKVDDFASIMGYNIDSFQDGPNPRMHIATNNLAFKGMTKNGLPAEDMNVKRGELLVSKINRVQLKTVSDTKTLKFRDFRQLSQSSTDTYESDIKRSYLMSLFIVKGSLRDEYPEITDSQESDRSCEGDYIETLTTKVIEPDY